MYVCFPLSLWNVEILLFERVAEFTRSVYRGDRHDFVTEITSP